MAAALRVLKAEYLKRYLSAPVDAGSGSEASLRLFKKLRKTTGAGGKGLRIVDDDVSWTEISTNSEKKEKEEEGELPVVVEFMDERPEEMKQMEAFGTGNKWKVLGEQKPDPYPPRKAQHDSPDLSPPRRTRYDSPHILPPRRTHHNFPPNLPDLAPEVYHSLTSKTSAKYFLGLNEGNRQGDESTQHKNRSSSSPWLRKQHHNSRDSCTSHRKFHFNPSSKKHQRHDVDCSLLGKSNQQPSDSDLSRPWYKQKGDSDSDLSPPRRKQKTSSSDSDLSPPQRSQAPGAKARQMSSGTKTGVVSYASSEQLELRRQDQEIKHLEVGFQNAETIFRDKSDCKRDLKLEHLEQRRKEDEESEKNDQYAQWGKGLGQSRQWQQDLEDAVKEMQKPFARYINDEDLDQMLREQEREGDPMANFIKRNKAKKNKNKKEKPGYNGPAPPLNRFNIWPGHFWDGVDRSNGFEEKYFARSADKKALEELAYKWSIEDM